jgi:coenzyme PQQ precursor peptide PqqA
MQDNALCIHGSVPSTIAEEEATMTWSKPQVTEQEVGLEVTSYVAAEIES